MNPYAAPKESTIIETGVNAEGVKVDDPTVLAWWTIGLLVVVTAWDLLVHVVLTFDAGGSLGAMVSMAWVETASSILLLVYFIIFLCWMYRVMWNSKRVDPTHAKINPGFGVGSYFIPILNFWVPCQALMQASRSTLGEDRTVLIWWLATMGVLVFAIIYVLMPTPEVIHVTEEMMNGTEPMSPLTWFDHFVAVTDVVIAFLEVAMILPLTRRQREWSLGGGGVEA